MDTLRRIIWTAIIQADGLRKYTGRYPGKDMPVVFNDAPGKGGRWKFPE